MTEVTFETATLADVVKRAARVAPTRGEAFDKAAGVMIEVSPSSGEVVVRATNLLVFYREWVEPLKAEGPDTRWRLNGQLLSSFVSALPIGSGKTVTFKEVKSGEYGKKIEAKSGRTKAQMNMMDPSYYPDWDVFDPEDLEVAPGLGGRLAQVEWAATKYMNDAILNGILFDGTHAVATDRFRVAATEVKLSDDFENIVVPSGMLSGLLPKTTDVRIGREDRAFLVMPDETTQIRCVIYDGDFPAVHRVMALEYEDSIKVRKTELLEMMSRAAPFDTDRFPTLHVFIGSSEVYVHMKDAEMGMFADTIELPNQAMHPRMEIRFTPQNLQKALEACPNEEVTIFYDHTNPFKIVKVDGGSGYAAWIMPRKNAAPQEAGE